jgi:hypothetical protein
MNSMVGRTGVSEPALTAMYESAKGKQDQASSPSEDMLRRALADAYDKIMNYGMGGKTYTYGDAVGAFLSLYHALPDARR